MQKKLSLKRAGSVALMGALLGGTGCGSPASPSEASTRTGAQALSAGVDFAVMEVRAPASVQPGEVFPAYVKVCNVGDTGGGVDVDLFHSSDAIITPQDTQIGRRMVDTLAPGQCSAPLEVSASVMQQLGGGYIGAIADFPNNQPEADEGNNVRAGGRLAVGLGPNFVVRSVSGYPSALPGGDYKASVTLCNEGTEQAHGEVELFLSADEVITRPGMPAEDTLLGRAPFIQLRPRQCVTQEVTGRANVAEGLWYLGALVDPGNLTQELDENDNAWAGSRLSVGPGADLVVKSVKGPESTTGSERLVVDVAVCNQGLEPAGGSFDLYVSADEVISGPEAPQPDVRITSDILDMLMPGQCATRRVQASGSVVPPGSWFLGAIAQTYAPERRTDNNVLVGSRLVAGDGPDFVVKSVKSAPSVQPGGAFLTSVTLCNQGTTGASAGAVLVLSRDADITWSPVSGAASDTLVAQVPGSMLMPGQCLTQQVSASSSNVSPGAWYLGAVVDPDGMVGELEESNNARAGNAVGVGPLADFIVKSVKGPASMRPGESFTASVEVCNQGWQSASSTVALVLSPDTDIQSSFKYPSSSDLLLGEALVGPLAAGQCATQQVPAYGLSGPPMMGAWYLGARVDPSDTVFELIEENNGLAGRLITVGDAADLVVKSFQVSAGPYPGAFTSRLTVCNEGTLSEAAHVGFFLSPGAEASRPVQGGVDFLQQMEFLGYLSPRQCETREVLLPANAPGEGPWYFKAVADPNAMSFEFIRSNNIQVAGPLAVGPQRPDFVVKSVKAPASVRPWEHFSTSVEVCNQGTQGGDTWLDVVFSADEVIAPKGAASGDLPGGVVHVDFLMPGQCAPYVVQGPAAVFGEGAYYLGVITDPQGMTRELNEDNNAFLGPRIGVGFGADFIVKSVKGPASARPGQSFTASVEVCNQGNQDGGVEGQLVLSADEVLSPFDVPFDQPLVSFHVPYLSAGQCTTQQVSTGSAPLPEGAWRLGAWVDPNGLMRELIEDNNGHVGGLMGIGDRADFVVKSVSGPTGVRPGQSFTASLTVCNQGTQSADTQVLLLVSSDTSIEVPQGPPGGDTVLGQVSTGMLNAGQCVTRQLNVSGIHLPEGAYYLGAVANPGQSPELIDSNNTQVGSAMGVGDAPDFVVRSVTGPASIRPNQPFNVSVRVCNQGTRGDHPNVELVLSRDERIALGEDMGLGYASLNYLDAGQCVTQDVSIWNTPMVSQGAYFLGAIADSGNWVRELLETNNTLAGSLVGVGDAPDFTVRSVTAPANVRPGDYFTTSVTVCNQGTRPETTRVMLLLSADEVLSAPAPGNSDFVIGDMATGYLDAGQCTTQEVRTSAFVSEGAWYVGALVNPDGWVQELNTANNQRVVGPMGVGHGADFIVKSVTGPATLRPGDAFTASATVCNQGTAPGYANVSLLLSQDTDIQAAPSTQDIRLGMESMGWLEPGRCVRMPVRAPSVYVPEPGIWYLGAVVDPDGYEFELNEDNNARASEALGVGQGVDFVVKAVEVPSSTRPYESFTATATVCNQGNVSGYTDVTFVLRTGAELGEPGLPAGPERHLGSAPVGPLEPGHCLTRPFSLNASPSPFESTWFVEAVVDLHNGTPELLEGNNARASGEMGVGHRPDLVITEVSAPRRVEMGAPFTTDVSVCNQGTEFVSDTRVELVLSSDERIDLQGPQPQPSEFPFASVWTGSLVPGQCVSIPVLGAGYPPSPGNWYVGGFVDMGNSLPELIESNNGLAGSVVEFHY